GPVINPIRGSTFTPRPYPVQAQDPLPKHGRVYATPKPVTPVQPAPVGPLFRQAVQAVRARTPVPFLKGRCQSSPGAPVRNPSPGPRFAQKPAPVRYVLPPWRPRAGRIGSSQGGPVINPIRGPTFTPRPYPVQAQDPLPKHG